jgi:hypothetical protein
MFCISFIWEWSSQALQESFYFKLWNYSLFQALVILYFKLCNDSFSISSSVVTLYNKSLSTILCIWWKTNSFWDSALDTENIKQQSITEFLFVNGVNKMVFIILRTQYYTIFLFTGCLKREHEVPDPDTMFSVSSAESQNELVFHQMQRIVDNDLL